jgi:hypothetical protein
LDTGIRYQDGFMTSKLIAGILVAMITLIGASTAMELSDIDAGQRVDWTRAGYPGAIPNLDANIIDVTQAGARGDGTGDDSAAIQAAIDTASAPAVIYFPAGTFLIEAQLSLKAGMVLRGAGYEATRLSCRHAGGCISIRGRTAGDYMALVNDAAKAATQIEVADGSAFIVGQGGQIRQADIVTAEADWGEGAVGQMVRIEAIHGNTLTVNPPLHLDYKAANGSEIRPITYVDQVGIEDLALERLDSGASTGGNNLDFRYAADCWVRRVESDWTEKYHLAVSESLHLEIRDSYFHGAKSRGGGGNGYGVSLARQATAILVENNIFYDLRHSMILQIGANGCVCGYNYAEKNYSDDDGGWAKTYISLHGHYAYMNLFEGNIIGWIGVGDYWGPIGPGNTLFRNQVLGTGRFDGFGDRHGIGIARIHGPQNIIANRLTGGSIYTSEPPAHPDVDYTEEWAKVLYHGNDEKGSLTWDPSLSDHSLPASFYLTAKPAFLDGFDWPPLGGDLPSNQDKVPARQRFQAGDYIPQSSTPDPGPNPAEDPEEDPEEVPDDASEDLPHDASGSGSSGAGCFTALIRPASLRNGLEESLFEGDHALP